MKAQNVLETIGNTPHIRIQKLFPGSEVWIKSERANPGGSIKDRIALAMVSGALTTSPATIGAETAAWNPNMRGSLVARPISRSSR